MKEYLTEEIRNFVGEYQKQDEIHTAWGQPLAGFADAYSPYIQKLKEIISADHALPQEVMPDASVVLVYYVPFTRELAKTNKTGTHFSSPQWALAYEETNAMFGKMNEYLIARMEEKGYHAMIAPQAATFDQKKLISNWSFRHFGYAAGLGTFGMNNMLITREGCCGRYNTIVTNLDVTPDQPLTGTEYCLYKKNGTCGVCFNNCPVGALTPEGYDRHRCYPVLQENARVYTNFGSSYVDETGENANSEGSEVCGKCVTQSPCAFWKL